MGGAVAGRPPSIGCLSDGGFRSGGDRQLFADGSGSSSSVGP